MLIKEVCQALQITKKAVEYYEKQGLLRPEIMENGYRRYSGEDCATLKEITVLRRCGISTQDIRAILASADKPGALARCRHLNSLRMLRMEAAQRCIDSLTQDYDIEGAFSGGALPDERLYTVREKMALAFPGSYGVWLSLHFGRFLSAPIETEAQREAYDAIIAYLDGVQTSIPEELTAFLEESLPSGYEDITALESAVDSGMREAIADPGAFMQQNDIEEYLRYRLSDEYRASPAGRMTELFTSFQRSSGYKEIFIAGLRALSPSYDAYCEGLEEANSHFLSQYPQAKQLYSEE